MKYTIVLLLALGVAVVSAEQCVEERDNCPKKEKVVWALSPNGESCTVFRNKCFFDKANETRRPALTVATKEECQKKCHDVCIEIFQPVSGIYKGNIREFGNSCKMNSHICTTGETYLPC